MKGRLVWLGIVVLVLCGIVWRNIHTSPFLSNRERITVGVYSSYPFVISYHKKSQIVTITWFSRNAAVWVPGGYQWYTLGNVRLLDAIEKRHGELVRLTFEELIGAPVDMVLMPRKTSPLAAPQESFTSFFRTHYSSRFSPLLDGSYILFPGTIIDRYVLARVLHSRNDKLLFIDSSSGTTPADKKDAAARYNPDKLDQLLKGYFYWSSIGKQVAVDVVIPRATDYGAAQRIGRIIEGMGIKVLDISVRSSNGPGTGCTVTYGTSTKQEGRTLAQQFHCKSGESNGTAYQRGIITVAVGQELATLYK